jgi:hypothetical protein
LKGYEFKLKVEANLVDHSSYQIVKSKTENKIVMIQPHLVNRLIQKFDPEVSEKRKYMMPGTPRFKIQRPTENMDVFEAENQKKYCSGVDMLLYLTKYSQPDIYNVVQEL